MKFSEYQDYAAYTAVYPGRGEILGLAYAALGAANEAGEVAGKVKKLLRDAGGELDAERADAILAEVGDVLWYLAEVVSNVNQLHPGKPKSLGDVAQGNVDKLLDRKSRGVIKGDGDNR